MLTYHKGDERPHWQATVPINGALEDLSTGYTFEVKAAKIDTPTTVALTKTAGIVGAAAGVVTVGWTPNELNIATGRYSLQLKATRTSDSSEWTIDEQMQIKARL